MLVPVRAITEKQKGKRCDRIESDTYGGSVDFCVFWLETLASVVGMVVWSFGTSGCPGSA